MKRFLCILLGVVGILTLVGCTEKAASEGDDYVNMQAEWPADLTDEDIQTVNELNDESNLFCNLYEEVEVMEYAEEPYELLAGERSYASAVTIPKDTGKFRIKEIEVLDDGFDVYGREIGSSLPEFEETMAEKGFKTDIKYDDMTYESFIRGNVYIAVNCDKDGEIERIFLNLLVDYNEWRGIE